MYEILILVCNACVGMAPVVRQSYASHVPEPDSSQLHGDLSLVGGDKLTMMLSAGT